MTASEQWTLVQHSAWVANQDSQFKHGLEERMVRTAAEQREVQKVGGLLFDSYDEACKFAEDVQYPAGYNGIIPRAPGTFAGSIDGSPIYVPEFEQMRDGLLALAAKTKNRS